MTDLDEVFTSNTLKASDLNERDVTLTITGVEIKKYEEGSKPVLAFAGTDKKFVCNITNARRIGKMHGDKNITENWIGKQITLYEEDVDFKGDTVPAIRVRIVRPKTKEVAKKEPWNRGADEPDDFSDPVPF